MSKVQYDNVIVRWDGAQSPVIIPASEAKPLDIVSSQRMPSVRKDTTRFHVVKYIYREGHSQDYIIHSRCSADTYGKALEQSKKYQQSI